MPDLFDAIVDGVVETDDRVQETVDRARALDLSHIKDMGKDALDEILRAALVASAQGMQDQLKTAADQVEQQGEAMKKQDPSTVRAITNADVAARRSAKLMEKASKTDGNVNK